MKGVVDAFNTLYDEVASLQAEAEVNGMTDAPPGCMVATKARVDLFALAVG